MSPTSAVIATIPIPTRLAAIRNAGDATGVLGVPAHVTILFPFVSAASLTASVRDDLGAIVARAQPFTARFARVERRRGVVWLVPADQAPFLALTAAVAARWPEHPPYGGIHEHLVAHLTILESDDEAALDHAAGAALEVGPVEVEVHDLSVIVEDAGGRWQERWRIPLGG